MSREEQKKTKKICEPASVQFGGWMGNELIIFGSKGVCQWGGSILAMFWVLKGG